MHASDGSADHACRQLQDKRLRLQQQVAGGDTAHRVSVYHLRKAFGADADLLEAVAANLQESLEEAADGRMLVELGAAAESPACTQPASTADGQDGAAAPRITPAKTTASSQCSAAEPLPARLPKQAKYSKPASVEWSACQLPSLDPAYTGRDAEAAALAEQLAQCPPGQRALMLLAPGGMGKSSLAIDVGWRLVRAGAVPGGALWADMREASSGEDVMARLCAAAGAQAKPDKVNYHPYVLLLDTPSGSHAKSTQCVCTSHYAAQNKYGLNFKVKVV